MKFEKLSSDRLQITLTFDDMNSHDIDFHRLCDNKENLNRFITFLLIKAKKDTDFDLFNGQFVIRVLQGSNEIIFTIIRITGPVDKTEIIKKPSIENAKYRLVEKKIEPSTPDSLLIQFESKEDFASFALNMIDHIRSDSALYDDDGTYCLLLKPASSEMSKVYLTATEFGTVYRNDNVRTILMEGRSQKIAEGTSILTIANLF